MSDLPPGWEWASLGAIAETSLGKMLDKGRATGDYPVPYLRNVNVKWGKFDLSSIHAMDIPPDRQGEYQVTAGDLLVCEGGEIGRCAVWPGSASYMAIQKALHRVRPHEGVDVRFLRYFLEWQSVTGALLPLATGSTIKHLPQQQLRRIILPFPPLAEQQRIVITLEDHLSRIDIGMELLAKSHRRLDRLSGQIISATLHGLPNDDPRKNYSHSFAVGPDDVGLQDGKLPRIPPHWRWMRLHEVADVVGGVAKDTKRQSDLNLREVPYLRVANVQRGHLDLSTVATIRVPPHKVEQLALRPGDVLLNEGGDRDKLARGWVWEGQLPLCIHQNHVFRARIRDDLLDPRILAWHANGFGQRWAEANGKQSVNLASISLSKIRQMPIPVPPKSEQTDIIEAIEESTAAVDRLVDSITAARARAEQLRRSLLADAFAGRLVPQDPADEPASVLLDRIRAERVASPTPRRTRRAARPDPAQETLS